MFQKYIRCSISLLAFGYLALVSLLNVGDVRAAWAHVGASGVGGASRSSGAESERAGRATPSGCEARELTSGRGQGPDFRALA
jgi:hypothetical protein